MILSFIAVHCYIEEACFYPFIKPFIHFFIFVALSVFNVYMVESITPLQSC